MPINISIGNGALKLPKASNRKINGMPQSPGTMRIGISAVLRKTARRLPRVQASAVPR